jgi:glycolate oxidase iron-sulfur subunit
MQVTDGAAIEVTNLKNLQGFDEKSPPNPKLIDSCVHCGFCLATCPSYRVLGKEMDSPRGRIYLMDAINQGEIALNQVAVEHFDSCLVNFRNSSSSRAQLLPQFFGSIITKLDIFPLSPS